MSRVKVPEFKVGDTINADQFNEAFSVFKKENLVLDGDNFADESLSINEIPDDISLTDQSSILLSEKTFAINTMKGGTGVLHDPWRPGATSYSGIRQTTINHPVNNIVTIQNLNVGDKFIIRASCNIHTRDGGWRTFMFGIPPIVKIGMVRFDGQTASDFNLIGSSNPNTFLLHETLAHYRIAYTGKMPSSSSLNIQVKCENRNSEILGTCVPHGHRDATGGGVNLNTHRDTRLDPDADIYGHPLDNPYMPFDGFHSYSTAYLYTHKAGNSTTQSFGIMCSEEPGKVGYNPNGSGRGDTSTGGASGCAEPSRLDFNIRNFHLFTYQVKK